MAGRGYEGGGTGGGGRDAAWRWRGVALVTLRGEAAAAAQHGEGGGDAVTRQGEAKVGAATLGGEGRQRCVERE